MPEQRIAVLAYPHCIASELYTFRDLWNFANQLAAQYGLPQVGVDLVTARGGSVPLYGGGSAAGERLDHRHALLVVPGFLPPAGVSFRQLLQGHQAECQLLRSHRANEKPLASICVGAFLLGQAGVLEGRRATTAWLYADALSRMFPYIHCVNDAMLVEDGGITTSGAFSAMHELTLHLMARFFPSRVVQALRNAALIDGVRDSQKPYLDPALLPARRSALAERLEAWLMARLERPYSLQQAAQALAVSDRTLLRKYKQQRGLTPGRFFQNARLSRARDLLQNSHLSVAEIAHRVGYNDVGAFRKLFKRTTGLTPALYRQRFALV